jgi:hypothetical protein
VNSTGFSIAVPNGWRVSHQGHYVYLLPPSGAEFLLIDQSDHPQANPLKDWQQQEANRESTYAGYHRIRLESARHPQAEKAADWEFTYYHQGTLTHVQPDGLAVVPARRLRPPDFCRPPRPLRVSRSGCDFHLWRRRPECAREDLEYVPVLAPLAVWRGPVQGVRVIDVGQMLRLRTGGQSEEPGWGAAFPAAAALDGGPAAWGQTSVLSASFRS